MGKSILQIPVQQLSRRDWDLVVAGAGPAGSTAAAHLAAKGASVLLVDRARFPREKVCGDGLVVDALRCLSRLGLLRAVAAEGHLVPGATIYSPSGLQTTAQGTFLTCRREKLDRLIAQKAVERGAVFAQGQVESITCGQDGRAAFLLSGCDEPMTARVGMVSTGATTSLLRKELGSRNQRPSAAAIRCYVRSREHLDRMLIVEDRSVLPGYGWIFPMGNNEYNVGVGAFYTDGKKFPDLKKTFSRFTREFGPARDMMEKAQSATPLKGGVLRCNLEGAPPFILPNILALGECIGSTYACIGEGIGSAMETGELAAQAAWLALSTGTTGALDQYPRLVEAVLRSRHKHWHLAHRTLAKAWLNDLFVYRVERDPHMKMAMERILNNTMDPIHILWLRGAVQDWLTWPARTFAAIRQSRRGASKKK